MKATAPAKTRTSVQHRLTLLTILLFALLLRIGVLAVQLSDNRYIVQQDHYIEYVEAMRSRTLNTSLFPEADKRLFPGLPFLIASLSPLFNSPWSAGLFISMGTGICALLLFYLLSKSLSATLLFSVFPPIWVKQSAKIATEPVTVFLLLASIFALAKKRPFLSGMLIGLSSTVRLISIFLLPAQLLVASNTKDKMKLLLGFLPTFSLLFLFNFLAFGKEEVFLQFLSNPQVGGAGGTSFGAIQILQDMLRAWSWEQYTILLSGTIYLVFNLVTCVLLFRYRSTFPQARLYLLWAVFSLLFIFSVSPVPLLEEFARFSVPFSPAVIFALVYAGKRATREMTWESLIRRLSQGKVGR